ncbi:MAG: hypothetical protein JNM80_11470 [Phycisphaerae bacterium]|nr:hypothetical protein [Phycisphaerae bacterium]
MAELGGYELLRESHRSALGSVWTARKAGESGPAAFAVKRSHPDPDILGREHADRVLQVFLSTVESMERAGRSATGFAPVLARGLSEDGAYWVTHWCGRGSAERLILTRATLDAEDLRRVVGSTLRALKSYWEGCGRGHGNLKPSNVLIRGEADVSECEILLTDPLPEADADAARDLPADVRAVGNLIHRLVTRQPPGERVGQAVREGPEWDALGKSGRAWRDLCERLVVPDPTAPVPTVDEVLEALPGAGGKGGRGLGVLVGIAAAVVLLGGGAAAYFLLSQPKPGPLPGSSGGSATAASGDEWLRFVREFQSVAPLFEGLKGDLVDANGTKRPRREAFAADASLKPISDVASRFDPASPTSLHPLRLVSGQTRAMLYGGRFPKETDVEFDARMAGYASKAQPGLTEAQSEVTAVRTAIRDWPARRALLDTAKRWEARGWAVPSREVLRSLRPLDDFDNWAEVDGDSPSAHEAAAEAAIKSIDWVLSRSPLIAQIEEAWTSAEKSAAAITAVDEPLLKRFGQFVQIEGGRLGTQSTSADLTAFAQAIERLRDVGVDLSAFVASDFKRVDLAEWVASDSVRLFADASDLSAKTFTDWKAEIVKPAFRVPNPADNPVASWKSTPPTRPAADALAKADRDIAALGGDPAESLADLRRQLADLERRVTDAAGLEYVRANFARIDADSAAIKKDIDALVRSIGATSDRVTGSLAKSKEQLEQQRARLQAVTLSDPDLQVVWRACLDALTRDSGQLGVAVPAATRRLDSLRQLEAALPVWTPRESSWADLLAKSASDSRRERLRALTTNWSGGVPPAEDISPAISATGEAYAAATRSLAALDDTLVAIAEAMRDAYAADEPLPSGGTLGGLAMALRSNPEFKNAGSSGPIAALAAHADEVVRIEAAPSASELEAIGTGASPSAAVAAWRKLATRSDWPTPRGLAAAQRAFEDATRAIDSVRDVARKRSLRAEAESLARAAWRRAADASASREDLATALSLRAAFRMDADQDLLASETPARVRFNAALLALRDELDPQSGTRPSDEAADARIRAFIEAFGSEASAPLADLRELLDAKVDPTPKVDLSRLGPGSPSVGWRCEDPDASPLTFVGPSGARLSFARLPDAPGQPAAFIAVTELSIESLAELSKSNAAAREQLRLVFEAQAAVQELRGWDWSAGGGLAPRPAWQNGELDPNPKFRTLPFYGADAPREAPSPRSPVQGLGPADALLCAHLLGCRLPTAEEFRRAATAWPSATPNLRDAAWGKHLGHVRQQRSLPANQATQADMRFLWPDAGCFPYVPGDKATAESAKAGPTQDGVIWFRDTPAAATTPADLVGNVAEYVLNHDDPPGSSLDGIKAALAALVQADPTALGVTGSSAIAPPEVDPSKQYAFRATDLRRNVGYSDLGVRLAFTAIGVAPPPVPLAKKAADLLSKPEALWLAAR